MGGTVLLIRSIEVGKRDFVRQLGRLEHHRVENIIVAGRGGALEDILQLVRRQCTPQDRRELNSVRRSGKANHMIPSRQVLANAAVVFSKHRVQEHSVA